MQTTPIHLFTPSFTVEDIDDLTSRLKRTRFPNAETVEDWSQGIPLSYQQELIDYWIHEYDHQRVPSRLNVFSNFQTEIDELDIHFIHHRSRHTSATPLLITHGWPGSVLEYLDVIEALTNPTEHGGSASDAFHVVLPALPGFGFSQKPRGPGVGVPQIASMWERLMSRLGYAHFHAHGGDWGSIVTQAILLQSETACSAGHCTLPVVPPDPSTLDNPLPEEIDAVESFQFYNDWDCGYSKQQSTRPQTLGYGLADSPAGQMAWIVEKFAFWMDCESNGIRHPENVISKDVLLDNVMLYWMTNSAASSARLYWESFNKTNLDPISRPIGLSVFPKEIMRTSERWARGRFKQLTHFNNQFERGGHFAAMEVPETLINELRAWRSTTP
ncbi:MAG: epoxide hydrolase 1 [Luminiphilus sp.]|jgi:pimeloyl-ACP methyl ester carboxylesterase|nr:epoxide hydrolase 1 [Luminiphilus sp.]